MNPTEYALKLEEIDWYAWTTLAPPAANLMEIKLLVNSTILDATNGARFMSADIKKILATPMAKADTLRCNIKIYQKTFVNNITYRKK